MTINGRYANSASASTEAIATIRSDCRGSFCVHPDASPYLAYSQVPAVVLWIVVMATRRKADF